MTTELTVLVVDDDFYVADLHRRQVEQLPGLRALPAVGTVAEVRRVLVEQPVDLLLLDVHLPDGSGLDLLREVDVDAFVLSAASDATTVRRALRRGALGYLIKPFASGTLVDRLRAYQRYRNVLDERTTVDQEALERALRILHSGDAAKAASPSRSATEQAVLEQFGAEAGRKLRGEQLRALLALLVLAVAGRLFVELVLPPAEPYSITLPSGESG